MANGAKISRISALMRGTSLSSNLTLRLVLASGLTLAVAAPDSRAAEVSFTPTANLRITQTDNVYLTDGGEEDDTVVSVDVGLQLRAATARLQSDFYYKFAYDKYDSASEFDGLRHDLRTVNRLQVSPNFFYIDLNGTIQERTKDRSSVSAATDRTYSGDLLRVTTLSARPYVQTVIGNNVEFLASVEYATVTYDQTDVGGAATLPTDIERTSEVLQLGTDKSLDPFTWSLNVTARQLDDERKDLDVLASAFFGLSGTMRLVARVGYDEADTTGDGNNEIEETHWRVGFDYRPSQRTQFRAEAGQRYNRTTYDLAASHEFKDSFTLTASYNHTLVTDAGLFVDFSATPIFDDEGGLIGFEDITADIVNDSYIQRRASIQAAGQQGALTYQLSFAYLDREFEFSPNDSSISQVMGRVDYLFSDRFKAFASVGLSNEDAMIVAQETDVERYSVGTALALSRKAFVSLQAVNQSYDYGTGMKVDENAIVLSVNTSW